VAVALAAPAAATAAPVDVNVRIEGRTQTLFDGQVRTDGKDLTTASGGTHRCDGTNGGASPTPGGTPTTALNDAAAAGGFSWDGPYDTNFDDYFVARVGQDPQTSSEYWGDFVNGTLSDSGGCQTTLQPGDSVLWAFDAFNKDGLLRASGPTSANVNQPFQVRVTDINGAPQPGAAVGSATTDANGVATLAYPTAGDYRLKAEKTRYVRSQAVAVRVQDPAVRDVAAPVLTGVSASSSVFSVDKRARASVAHGTGFRFALSEPATVVFRTEQRVGRKWKTIRVFGQRYKAGPNVLRFSGRIKPRGKARTLRPGRYRLSLRPSDVGGNRGALSRVGFKIVR
jgi:hypothetical protein